MSDTSTVTRDYSETLFLPKTEFPMRAGLPKKEPELLARWRGIGLYKKLREAAKDRPRFVLHDGPPYANGNIHIGHALNKIMKDLVTRAQQMSGFDSNYVPGWDCHGLPIEWKIEEQYRAKGKNKDEVDPVEFRKECRAFAEGWVKVQSEEFQRLGVVGDWAQPYLTMSYAAEAQIAREIMKFAETDQLYRGSKPVLWSVVERTALAEAEVEYQEYQSDTITAAFPIKSVTAWGGKGNVIEAMRVDALLKSTAILIWTTTPWTIPGNRAIAFSAKIAYGIYRVDQAPQGNWAKVGALYMIADKLAEEVMRVAKVEAFSRVADVPNEHLKNVTCTHPLARTMEGYAFDVPLLEGDHVTDDAGTGFVHTSPGAGVDDFDIWMAHGRELTERGIDTHIPTTVDGDGFYTVEAPGFTGKRVITDKGDKGNANQAVIDALAQAGTLVTRGRLRHAYPHSWRSKKPLIFRNTPQWFIHMDKPIAGGAFSLGRRLTRDGSPSPLAGEGREGGVHDTFGGGVGTPLSTSSPQGGREQVEAPPSRSPTLRELALAAIRATKWVPQSGENRITGMIEDRPDWVVSRQRAWGVPIAVFYRDLGAGKVEILKDERVNKAIADAFEAEGADAWFASADGRRFLEPFGYSANEWVKVDDILDVWFDSGSTHAFTLEVRPDLATHRMVDGGRDQVMYLEGSDQHRGWFHSSLLESCGTRGRAPFDVVLTHGFVLDEKGEKMSKSVGNVVAPQEVMKNAGADILRLWVAASDYADDLRIGPKIIENFVDTYRKLRNTIRWMLGTLAHYRAEEAVAFADMPELERFVLHRLTELDEGVRAAYAAFDYKRVIALLSAFMTSDLSAFYFDIRKDALYCDPISSVKRRAALTVVEKTFRAVVTWLAPILVFTCEEAWLDRYPSADGSVHAEPFEAVPTAWRNEALGERWEKIRRVRRVVTGALEIERAAKRIGSSLEAAPVVHVADEALLSALDGVDFAETAITSGATIVRGEGPLEAFRLTEVPGVAVVPKLAEGRKCARSWKISIEVGANADYPDLTPRDAQAMREWEAARRRAG